MTLLVTFSACLCFGVEVGLVLGMALDLTRLLHVWARPRITITICCVRTRAGRSRSSSRSAARPPPASLATCPSVPLSFFASRTADNYLSRARQLLPSASHK